MSRTILCAIAALIAAIPNPLFGSIQFANHSQACSNCGDYSFYHADFNNDSFEDLAYIQDLPQSGNPIFVIKFANKDGSYSAGTKYKIPSYDGNDDSIAQLALADVFHDGNIDVIAFTWYSGKAYIYRNDGKGVFTLRQSIQFAPEGAPINIVSTVAADFNHDGNVDLAVDLNQQLQLWAGDGSGGFTPQLSQSIQGIQIALGDFDGDGKADLLVYNDQASPNMAYVYYGDNTGHFPQSVPIEMPSQSLPAFSIGDVNSDGKSDVMAVANTIQQSRVFVFYGDAARQFANSTTVLVGRCISGPSEVADMDGNGLNDLIVTEGDCNNIRAGAKYVDVLTRNPDSSYNPDQTIYWAQPSPDGNIYEIDQVPLILRADQDATPDLLVQQCNDTYCLNHVNTTQLNTTSGSWPSCAAPFAAEGITICSPLNGTASGSPVQFQIGLAGPVPMRDVEVWVDGSKVAEQIDGFSYYSYLNSSVPLAPGSHNVTVFGAGWDQSLVKKAFTLQVQ